MTSPTDRLRELGLTLPPLPSPAGTYVHAVRTGNLMFLAGKGATLERSGKVGRDVSVEEGYEYARQTGLVLLAVMAHELGSLDRVTRIVKVFGAVNAVLAMKIARRVGTAAAPRGRPALRAEPSKRSFHQACPESLEGGMLCAPPYADTSARRRFRTREMIGMLHWKVKLAHVAVVAALLAAFLSDLEGWAW